MKTANVFLLSIGLSILCTSAALGCKIGDYVWLDLDCDGIQDSGEPGIPGVTLTLWHGNQPLQTTITDTSGHYLFEIQNVGTYCVKVEESLLPSGYVPAPCNVGDNREVDNNCSVADVTLTSEKLDDMSIDFGYCSRCTGAIGDYVWFDADRDGIQDAGEQGINGVEVWLADSVGIRAVTTATGGTLNQPGYYLFDGLCAGTYTVAVNPDTVPAGYEPTSIHVPGSTSENDSDNPGRTTVTLPTDNSRNLTIDFGYVLECRDCKGGVTQLTLQYLGEAPDEGIPVVIYEGTKPEESKVLFAGLVAKGAEFSFWGIRSNLTMSANINIYVNGVFHTTIHTSCSQPIGPGLVRGDFKVIAGESKDGGRLCPLPPEPDCGACEGQVTRLTLRYLDATDALVTIYEGTKPEASKILFNETVGGGGDFTFTGIRSDLKMGSNIGLYVNGIFNTTIHTSCSQPIGPGLVRGDFQVIEGYSKDGGRLCPLPAQPDCGACKGGVTELVLRYNGDSGSTIHVAVYEGTKIEASKLIGEGDVQAGSEFGFSGEGPDGKLGSNISLTVGGQFYTTIHTSCSQPIGVGQRFGFFEIVEGRSKDGGPLCPLPPEPGCGACEGGVTELVLQYNGTLPAEVSVYEGTKVEASKRIGGPVQVDPGDQLAFSGTGSDGKLGSNISLTVGGQFYTTIHTSCSQPIGVGQKFGIFEIVAGRSKDGGPLCPLPPAADCGVCKGGVVQLTLKNNGSAKTKVAVYEGMKGEASKLLQLVPTVGEGGQFTILGRGSDGNMGSNISIYLDGVFYTAIHTSCSQPIGPGLVRGDFEVVEGYSKDGGKLCPLPPEPGCGECKGGVVQLTLRYTGDLSNNPTVKVYEGTKAGSTVLFEGKVATNVPPGEFTFVGKGSDQKMGSNISVYVDGKLDTTIHTSCSQPIGPGLVRGSFEVVEGYSKDGGRLCAMP